MHTPRPALPPGRRRRSRRLWTASRLSGPNPATCGRRRRRRREPAKTPRIRCGHQPPRYSGRRSAAYHKLRCGPRARIQSVVHRSRRRPDPLLVARARSAAAPPSTVPRRRRPLRRRFQRRPRPRCGPRTADRRQCRLRLRRASTAPRRAGPPPTHLRPVATCRPRAGATRPPSRRFSRSDSGRATRTGGRPAPRRAPRPRVPRGRASPLPLRPRQLSLRVTRRPAWAGPGPCARARLYARARRGNVTSHA
mmetsp:Transcript_18286/g.56651  ORF Transcript_18286/g.56651 Transcript_18286/m.56651 type:complete len:251 (-) Transcript_18286:629-1381(-)